MAERHLKEEIEIKNSPEITIDQDSIGRTSVMTGDINKARYLLYQLKFSMKEAERIDIIVSFLMESGVRLLLNDLQYALDRGVKIRILTGNYLGITQPSALYLLKYKLGDRIDLRFYNDSNRSFHPKSYIFHYSKFSDIYIGSSNISRSALTSGIEWNYRFRSSDNPWDYQMFYDTFENLFNYHSIEITDEELKRYSKNWHQPAAMKDLERYDSKRDDERELDSIKVKPIFEPRGAQIEALWALKNIREEGARKGLVCAATGVGKTYLAAFDSREFKKVLFVAHREEILSQAAQSFYNVRQSKDYGFFNGKEKTTDRSVIFASVATLGRENYLTEKYFPRNYFDYIVIDEFHHSVNEQYRRIVEYFSPKFLLGLTATPERMDGRSIYEICDYNVPYEIGLREAINKGMLVPFHYYGIFDDTDYSGLHLVRGRFDEKQLNERYLGNAHRHDVIYKYYRKYGSRRALGFCCSRDHAEEMAGEFTKRGIPSVAVYSNATGIYSEDRSAAIEKLRKGEIRVIFSVDMFNEGVDITNVDMVMFLRPTESPTVFLQQLGRGLRKSRGKEYLNVLDFIGNYEKAGNIRRFLHTALRSEGKHPGTSDIETPDYPDGCMLDFDMRLIDLFQEMDRKNQSVRDLICEEYLRIENLLQKVPTRLNLFTYMDEDVYTLCKGHSKDNPFRNYLLYLEKQKALSPEVKEIYNGIGHEFLNLLETTNMSKVYKMPVLLAFYNNGNVLMEITEEQVVKSWKEFFSEGTNWKDLKSDYTEFFNMTDQQHLRKIKEMPVKFLMKSGKGFFVQKDGCVLSLCKELQDVIANEAFAEQMGDIIQYRIMDYYQSRYRNRED